MHVWVVEIRIRYWVPTISCKSTLQRGKRELRKWEERAPNSEFRLRKYVRVDKIKKLDIKVIDEDDRGDQEKYYPKEKKK